MKNPPSVILSRRFLCKFLETEAIISISFIAFNIKTFMLGGVKSHSHSIFLKNIVLSLPGAIQWS